MAIALEKNFINIISIHGVCVCVCVYLPEDGRFAVVEHGVYFDERAKKSL